MRPWEGFPVEHPRKAFQKQREIFRFFQTQTYIQVMGRLCEQLRQLHIPSNQVTKLYTNRMYNQGITK